MKTRLNTARTSPSVRNRPIIEVLPSVSFVPCREGLLAAATVALGRRPAIGSNGTKHGPLRPPAGAGIEQQRDAPDEGVQRLVGCFLQRHGHRAADPLAVRLARRIARPEGE